MSRSVPYSDPSASGICLPQASKYLSNLKLHLNTPEPAVICTICKYALHPDSVTRHVAKHKVPLWERAALTQVVQSLHLPDPRSLCVRSDYSPVHPQLALRHGYSCSLCEHRTTSSDLFGRHLRKEHGRSPAKKGLETSEALSLQSWSENGASGFWIIQPPGGKNTLDAASIPRRMRLEQLHNLEHRALSVQQANAASDVGGSDMTLVNNWMHRTGWNELFTGNDRALLMTLSGTPSRTRDGDLLLGQYEGVELRSPATDEAKLRRIAVGVTMALERCRDTVRHTDISIRCWLRGQAPDRPYKAPFILTGRLSSQRTYERLICRCICFCIRLWRLQASNSRVPLRRDMTVEQCRALNQIWSHDIWSALPSDTEARPPTSKKTMTARNDQQISEDSSYNDDESENDYLEEEMSDDGEQSEDEDKMFHNTREVPPDTRNSAEGATEQPHGRQRLYQTDSQSYDHGSSETTDGVFADLVLQLLQFLATEECEDGRPSSTLLIYFASVVGISSDGLTFERPSNYTPKLSGLIHCIRLVLLETTLPRFPHPMLGWDVRPRRGQLEVLNSVRLEKMCFGSQAPMGELLSLRSYGRALSRSDGPSFRVHWSDDGQIVSWADGSLTMTQFREIGRGALKHAASCCDRLMYHWSPSCDISSLRDKLSDMSYGYSFVTDSANGLTDAYLELSRRACLSDVGGLMADENWDTHAVRQYLDLQREFQGSIMVLISLFGGQMPRGTDLLAVAHCNSAANRRGVFIYEGKIAIMTQVNKARRATNREFYVVRYLPDVLAPLLYNYLVYIRRFCNMLYRTCLELNMETLLLFPSVANPHEPRKTEELTKMLKICTENAIGIALGVRVYRQLTIAITEKHIKQTSRPFNRYDDTTFEADSSVAYAWQSGHRPIQRGTSYGLNGAFPDSLQPALLNVYKWVSGEWHRFLRLVQISQASATSNSISSTATEQAFFERSAIDDISTSVTNPMQQTGKQSKKTDGEGRKRSGSPILANAPSSKKQKHIGLTAQLGQPTSTGCHPRADCESYAQAQSDNSLSGSPWATPVEIETLRRAPSIPWPSCSALFGRANHLEKPATLEEQRIILAAIQDEEERKNRYFYDHERLRVLESLRKWSNVGCQLCFLHTHEPQPDHTLRECRLWACCEQARTISYWLEKLPIPLYVGERGCCSLCSQTDAPCDEMRLFEQMKSAPSADEKLYWKRKLEAKSSPDGHCENRSITRDVIAALCSYDDQLLGKVLATKISKRDGVNFAAENQISYWFCGRIPFKGEWVMRLLFVYEMLGYAYEFRQQSRAAQVVDRPPLVDREDAISMDWDDQNEVKHWKRCLQWWVGKCSFCAGKGQRGALIEHTLKTCHRGGARQLQRELGVSIYLEGFRPRSGCPECGSPREFCERWQSYNGTWRMSGRKCQYGTLIYDTVIGLFYCDERAYRIDAYSTMEEDSDPDNQGRTGEDVAIWLCTRLEVADVETSLFIRTVAVWTKMVWRRQAAMRT